MKLSELFEGRLKNLAIDQEYDNKHIPQPQISRLPTKKALNYYITINGRPWRENGEIKPFETERIALTAANSLHARKPQLRIDVLPYKKGVSPL